MESSTGHLQCHGMYGGLDGWGHTAFSTCQEPVVVCGGCGVWHLFIRDELSFVGSWSRLVAFELVTTICLTPCLLPWMIPAGLPACLPARLSTYLQLDYGEKDTSYNRIKTLVNEELKQYFRPEFLNRLDEIIVFRQLTKLEVKEIADIMLKEVFDRLKKKDIDLQVRDGPSLMAGCTAHFHLKGDCCGVRTGTGV